MAKTPTEVAVMAAATRPALAPKFFLVNAKTAAHHNVAQSAEGRKEAEDHRRHHQRREPLVLIRAVQRGLHSCDLSYHSARGVSDARTSPAMSDLSQLNVPSKRSRVSPEEWRTRVDLAACYRL